LVAKLARPPLASWQPSANNTKGGWAMAMTLQEAINLATNNDPEVDVFVTISMHED
jgi:hypothetical protein